MTRKRLRLRVAWDGPYPREGHFIAGKHPGLVWRVEGVFCDRAASGEIGLTLARYEAAAMPASRTLHPAERIQQSDTAGPARSRQMAGAGPIAVMQASWRDPDDTKPNAARRPRQITGYRTYCALRRMAAGSGSQISEAHIAAADAFRAQVDLALIGRCGISLGDLAPQGFGPSAGPSAAAIEQAFADREVRRVLRRFAPGHCLLLTHVVLLNHSLGSWVRNSGEREGAHITHREMGRLLTMLDILADHYETDVKSALREGVG